MPNKSNKKHHSSMLSRWVRCIKNSGKYKYNGHDPYGERAYSKVGAKQDLRYIITGKKRNKKVLREQYKKEKARIESKEDKKAFISGFINKPLYEESAITKPLKKPAHRKKPVSSAYNGFDKKYRNNNLKLANYFKPIEHAINVCDAFTNATKRIMPSISKVVAFVRLANDGRKIIISVINIVDSVDKLIDIAMTEEDGLVPVEESFKELVDIIKETKDIYDTVKDAAEQLSIIIA